MLDALKLVKGAVDVKNLVPVLTHFHIHEGIVQGGNGRVSLQTYVPELRAFDNVTAHAASFVAAIEACVEEPKITIDEEVVVFAAGKFRCRVPRLPSQLFTTYPLDKPDTIVASRAGGWSLLPALATLREFIGNDASRPWAIGAWLSDSYAYGTNNVVIARVPLPFPLLHPVNMPGYAIDELLRVSREPCAIGVSEGSITFYFDDAHSQTWLKAKLLVNEWPDVASWFIPRTKVAKVPTGMLAEVQRVKTFVEDRKNPMVRFLDGELLCGTAAVGGFKLPDGCYRTEPLEIVLAHATHAAFEDYPGRVYWKGANAIEGFIVGMKT